MSSKHPISHPVTVMLGVLCDAVGCMGPGSLHHISHPVIVMPGVLCDAVGCEAAGRLRIGMMEGQDAALCPSNAKLCAVYPAVTHTGNTALSQWTPCARFAGVDIPWVAKAEFFWIRQPAKLAALAALQALQLGALAQGNDHSADHCHEQQRLIVRSAQLAPMRPMGEGMLTVMQKCKWKACLIHWEMAGLAHHWLRCRRASWALCRRMMMTATTRPNSSRLLISMQGCDWQRSRAGWLTTGCAAGAPAGPSVSG